MKSKEPNAIVIIPADKANGILERRFDVYTNWNKQNGLVGCFRGSEHGDGLIVRAEYIHSIESN